MALLGIFIVKFFDHVFSHALKIFQQTCSKIAHFIHQSEFRKKSNFSSCLGIKHFLDFFGNLGLPSCLMATITNIYAGLLFVLGLVGFLSNPSKAISSLIVGLIAALVFMGIAALIKRKKRGAYLLLAIIAGLFSLMLVWRTNNTWMAYFGGQSEKLLAAILMSCMLTLSLVMTGLGFIAPGLARK